MLMPENVDAVDGFEIRHQFDMVNIPLFPGFSTSQVVSRISEPSTVLGIFFCHHASMPLKCKARVRPLKAEELSPERGT